ncbi:PREDICTED: WD repeat-containing protein 66-like [Atta cephalotes]|uniref:Cilia- and flagella-associated protein 251 n=1 Tax=Atta cephalotes TaxID=12957 RepID=A0A158P2J9_ATTCE|nr:PREDICTED: WD repeat-containing protein 66-like [Atta cephalotes]
MAIYTAAFPSIVGRSQAETTEDTESIEITVKKKCREQGFTEKDICPFKLWWSFGLNPEVPVINLTTKKRTLLAYACSHVAVIYDYDLKKMLPLLGHRNFVKMLSTSRNGKWLLTADSGKDNVVMICDTEKGISICTLFNPHNNEDITAAAISPNAKQIVTVSSGRCQNVHFWLWTYGRDKPDASTPLINITERVKEITFNDECPEQFALTTDHHVLFLTWNGHALSYDCPKVMTKVVQHIGVFNTSCYVPKIQQVFTASTNDYILVWDNVSYKDKHASDDINKKKKHRKTFNLQKSSITVIIDNEGMLVTGNSNGRVTFYDYQLRLLYWRYVLVCGLKNGALWILHHITLDPIDEIPYKHSSTAINKIIFTRCAEYMAYANNALTVVVFKRNDTTITSKYNMWNLIGKYRSHYLPIRDILFSPAASDSDAPRFFSLGEDRELVEYDLAHSGPYPVPGLKILRIDQIEQSAVPLCLAWYPVSDNEKFLMISNSEILTDKVVDNGYVVFATDKEIGLQLMSFDGNPYKIVSTMGHSQKIIGISVNHNKKILFTAGYNDPCVLMWKIKLKLSRLSVDIMARLGGKGLSPFYCLIKGGKKGWLANEMKDLFYYAQILHQGENTTAARIISDTVVVEQIPNLMRAVGYFPTNKEVSQSNIYLLRQNICFEDRDIMTEVCYKRYVETDKLLQEITFEEFVRLYVNHRPVFAIYMRHIKEAFHTFIEEDSDSMKNLTLTREQLVDILLGGTVSKTLLKEDKPIGELLTLEEAYTYLKTLMFPKEEMVETQRSLSQKSVSFNFHFLPARISYKDFTMDIVGVESLEETMADN